MHLWQSNSAPWGCAEWGGLYQGNYTTCTPNPCVLGDMNCDGVRDGLDIQHFVQALIDPAGYTNDHDGSPYPNCNILKGDMNYDTFVDINDISDFVYLLVNP